MDPNFFMGMSFVKVKWQSMQLMLIFKDSKALNLNYLYLLSQSTTLASILLLIIQLKMMMGKKKLCKFKETCKNFMVGKDCGFSHDRCRFGDNCRKKAECMYYHDSSNAGQTSSLSAPKKEFSQPKNEVQCKFGKNCNKLAQGKCPFKHTPQKPNIMDSSSMSNVKRFDLPKHETPCQFGARCNMLPLGKCPFKHDPSIMPLSQFNNNPIDREKQKEDTSQTFKNVLSNLCFDFLMNRSEHQQCGRLHEYTSTKNIKKIFQVDNIKITKCSIFQYYQQEQQPIYVVLSQGRIVFGQYANLAKESGMEHINNSAMVFKRCYERDIAFHGEAIEDFYLMHTLNQQFPRMDILVVKGSKNLHVCIINNGGIQSFPNNRNIISATFIKSHLIIVFQDKSKLFLRFDPSTIKFQQDNIQIPHQLSSFKNYLKKLYGSQIIGSISQQKKVCFINQKLETHFIEIEQKVKDLLIIEVEGNPYALILTERQLFTINLVTFQKKSALESGLGQGLQFTSIAYTLNYLFLMIDNWGILVYNLDNLETPAGVLSLGDRQWRLVADDRGNISVISRQKDGYSSWWVYKVRRN